MEVEADPVGVQKRTVSHFKGLINAKVDLEAQGYASTFTFCQKSFYTIKGPRVYIFFSATVPNICSIIFSFNMK